MSVLLETSRATQIARLRREARILDRLGYLHIVPVGVDKLPTRADGRPLKWRHGPVDFVANRPPLDLLDEWSTSPAVTGWAALTGAAYAPVTLDVEVAGMAYPGLLGVLNDLPRSCRRDSFSGGAHGWIRPVRISGGVAVPVSFRSERLATIGPKGDRTLLVELLGVTGDSETGGGSSGKVAVITGPGRGELSEDFAPVVLDEHHVAALLDRCRTLNEPEPTSTRGPGTPPPRRRLSEVTSGMPSTADVLYAAAVSGALSWLDVLPPGWTYRYTAGGREYYLRPPSGKPSTADTSASAADGILTVFSTSVEWSADMESFNPAQLLAASRFGHDFRAAMTAVESAADMLAFGRTANIYLPSKVAADISAANRARRLRLVNRTLAEILAGGVS